MVRPLEDGPCSSTTLRARGAPGGGVEQRGEGGAIPACAGSTLIDLRCYPQRAAFVGTFMPDQATSARACSCNSSSVIATIFGTNLPFPQITPVAFSPGARVVEAISPS